MLATAALILSLLVLFAWGVYQTFRHPCLRWHLERVWIDAATKFVDMKNPGMPWVGNGPPLPVYVPGHWEDKTVCDVSKP